MFINVFGDFGPQCGARGVGQIHEKAQFRKFHDHNHTLYQISIIVSGVEGHAALPDVLDEPSATAEVTAVKHVNLFHILETDHDTKNSPSQSHLRKLCGYIFHLTILRYKNNLRGCCWK